MRLEEIPAEYFQRQDEAPDRDFYRTPRLVAHIDDEAIAALGTFLQSFVPEEADVLDLMSAYLTHMPPAVRSRCRRVAGLGMSGIEMGANTQLSEYVVYDLNADPALPYPDESFDIVLCTVSVQYLLHPAEVFAGVYRILRPGGRFLVSFSNRCFPTKATRLWLSTDDAQHVALVRLYLEDSGKWAEIITSTLSPHPGTDPLFAVAAHKSDGKRV